MIERLKARGIRLAPVFGAAILALGGLKSLGLWVSFSPAAAEEEVSSPAAPAPVAEGRLLQQLDARKRELDARETTLGTREKVLAAAELRLEAALGDLEREKQVIAAATDARQRDSKDEIDTLTSAYERMKPRDAAKIFAVLDDDILLPIAAGMRTQALAGVLAEMDPQRAKALTIALANRGAATDPAPAAVALDAPAPMEIP